MNSHIELYIAWAVIIAFFVVFVFIIKDLSKETWADIIRTLFTVMAIVLAAFALIWAINTITASL